MTIINALPYILLNGTTADATQVMADFNQILNDTNNNAAHNGVNTDITALTALVTPITPAQGGSTSYYGAGSGTANAQLVAATAPLNFTLAINNHIIWTPSVSNTGATTLKVGATTATNVYTMSETGPVPLIGGEIISGQLTEAIYDGTQFILLSTPMQSFGTLKNIASASTTDIGAGASHTLNITGTTTITSFGSTASTAYPLYSLVFSGILTLTYNATSLILPGSLSIVTAVGDSAIALYLGSGNWQIISYFRRNGTPLIVGGNLLQNYLAGLTLSTAGSVGTFGIAAGQATDNTNTVTMVLGSAYTKTTASWAVGTGNGALDTGAIAANTWYHVFLIYRSDTGVVDVLFSTSPASPTLPASYTNFRRIGAMKTDGASHWILFNQQGDNFIWATAIVDSTSVASSTANTITLASVPSGVVVEALFRFTFTGGNINPAILFSALIETDQAPSFGGPATCAVFAGGASTSGGGAAANVRTNTSQQIRQRAVPSLTTTSVVTYGWNDLRGK